MNLKNLLFFFFLYLLIAIILTFPLLLKINNSYGTTFGSDSKFYIWNLWKFKYDIVDLKVNPIIGKDISLFYPIGYLRETTGYDSLINMVAGIFLQFIFNPITTYNILIFFNLSLAALASFILADYFVKDKKISFLSGIIFGLSPFMIVRALAHLNVLTTGWLVFFIYFFIRMIKEKKWKFSILAAFFYFLTAISFWYYAIFALFFITFVLIYILIKKSLRKKVLNLVFVKNILLFIFISICLVLPVVFPFARTILNKEVTQPPDTDINTFSANIFSYFLPLPIFLTGKIMKIDPLISLLSGNFMESGNFIGFLEIAVLLSFLIMYPKNEKKKIIIMFIIVFFVLSLGPYLKPTKIPLPYKILTYLPFSSFLRSVNRLSIFVYLGISLAFALFLKYTFSYLSSKKKKILLLFFFFLLIFERLAIPFPLESFSPSPFYQDIKNQNNDFAILDLPPDFQQKYNLLQTFHNKNIVFGKPPDPAISSQIYKEVFENPFSQFSYCHGIYPDWLEKAGVKSYFFEKPLKQSSPEELFKKLKEKRIFFIIIHKNLIRHCPKVEERLNNYFSKIPVYFEDDQIKVFSTKTNF